MEERKRDSKFIPNRIDRDPPVMLGVTAPELKSITYVSIPVFLLSAFIFGFLFGSFVYGVLSGVFMAVITLFVGLLWLAAYKRNKPRNYVIHRKQILMDQLGVKKSIIVYQSELFSSKDQD